MTTFQEMLESFKSAGSGFVNKSTMQWFLNEIKETYKELLGDDTGTKESSLTWQSQLQRSQGTDSEAKVDSTATQGDTGKSDSATARQTARDAVANSFVSETRNSFDRSAIGKLLFYQYDPKTKDKLNYWDMFPICIPFSYHSNGWTGMNLHYLHPMMRAKLLAQLMTLANTKEMDPITKLNVTYDLLKKSSRFAYFTPCIKRYLISHVRSRLMIINPKQWVHVAMMPLANFQKSDEIKVWQDSTNQILKEQGQWKNG